MEAWYADLADTIPTAEEVPIPPPPTITMPTVQTYTVGEALDEWISEEKRGDDGTVQFHWPTLDIGLGKAIRPGELVVIAARSGVGKTWIAQHLVEQTLIHDPTSAAALWEGEMPVYQIAERLAAHALRVTPRNARNQVIDGRATSTGIMRANPHLERLILCEQSTAAEDLPGVLAASRDRGVYPTMLVVDYLGLLHWSGNPRAPRYERTSDVARTLKTVAIAERVTLICCVQLSRAAGDGTVEPEIDHLRDSGAIEENADRVVMAWRDASVDETEGVRLADGTELFCKIAKNRFGATGYRTRLRYDHALQLGEVP